jgi:hypothetical protein
MSRPINQGDHTTNSETESQTDRKDRRLAGRNADWQACMLAGWQTGREDRRLAEWQTGRVADWLAGWQADSRTGRKAGKIADWQASRLTVG